MNTANYPVLRKQSALVAAYVEEIPPSTPVKKIKRELAASQHALDPRPNLAAAYKLLERVTNDRGNSLLHEGVLKKNRSLCRVSLKNGIVSSRNNAGETPLHLAIRADWAYGVSILLKNGTSLLVPNNQEATPLELAAELNRPHYILQIAERISSLDQAIPTSRQYRFLSTIWHHRHKECLVAVANILAPKKRAYLYEYRYNENPSASILRWILNPLESPDSVKISFSSKDRDSVLYHFAGKTTFLFTKDLAHVNWGSIEESMYTLMLWTWRNFWHSSAISAQALLRKIDVAIGDIFYPLSDSALAKKATSGKYPIIIPTGWDTHSIVAVFSKDWLFICNRGKECLEQEHRLSAFRINKKKVTAALIQKLRSIGKGQIAAASSFLIHELPSALDGVEDDFCREVHAAKCQPSDLYKPICVAANMRLAIYATLLSYSKQSKGHWDFSEATAFYKNYILSTRYTILQKYLARD